MLKTACERQYVDGNFCLVIFFLPNKAVMSIISLRQSAMRCNLWCSPFWRSVFQIEEKLPLVEIHPEIYRLKHDSNQRYRNR